jgi:hypothetical protein
MAYEHDDSQPVAQRFERAIETYLSGIDDAKTLGLPSLLVTLELNLASALRSRPSGDRAANLNLALQYGTSALVLGNKEDEATWATAHSDLGITYMLRIDGIRAENVAHGIRHFKEALKVRTQTKYPAEWAQTTNNLGYLESLNRRSRYFRVKFFRRPFE